MTAAAHDDAHPFRAAWRTRDLATWMEALAPDVELHSPILQEPFVGRMAAEDLYRALFATLTDVRITHASVDGPTHAFGWEARAGGRLVTGLDLLEHDAEGRIVRITVFLRPLVGIATFAAAVGPTLAGQRSRWRAVVARVMTAPLRPLFRAIDVLSRKLTGS